MLSKARTLNLHLLALLDSLLFLLFKEFLVFLIFLSLFFEKRSEKGEGVSHPIGHAETPKNPHSAQWGGGMAKIVSQYRTIWGRLEDSS